MEYIINYFTTEYVNIIIGMLIGYGIGMLTGLFGAGGGFLVTPLLNIVMGMPMNLAVGTSSCQVLGASTFTIAQKFDIKKIDIKLILLIVTGVPLGSFLGSSLVKKLKVMPDWEIWGSVINPTDFGLLAFLLVFLSGITLFMFIDNFILKKDNEEMVGYFACIKLAPVLNFKTVTGEKFSATLLVIMGVMLGFLSSLLGVGGGVILFPALFYLVGQDTISVTKSSTILVFVSSLFATYFHILDKNIDYILSFFLVVGAFLGTKMGLMLQEKLSAKKLRKYFVFVVFAACLLVAYKLLELLEFLRNI